MQAREYLRLPTGEPYQPVRFCFEIYDSTKLQQLLHQLHCMQFDTQNNQWQWYRRDEGNAVKLLTEFATGNNSEDFCLGILTIVADKYLYIDLLSFQRAYLSLPLLAKWLDVKVATIKHADIYNRLSSDNTTLIKNFNEFFNEEMLVKNLREKQFAQNKLEDILPKIAHTQTSEKLLMKYADMINNKALPAKERCVINLNNAEPQENKVELLAFTTALLLREMVAHKYWEGSVDYTIAHAIQDAEQLAGNSSVLH